MPASDPDPPPVVEALPIAEDEIVTEESTSPEERKIRVYDRKGDFIIVVPAGAKVTFGYFNPAGPRFENNTSYDRSSNVAVQTALRIYERGEKGNQLACFLGINGFRDETVKLTRLSQRVVIETNLHDDGEGNMEWGGSQQKQLIAAPEPDTYA